ncbi:MAG: carboxyl transferase domain-containing protein [Eubacteriales bacterium]|nr:carboxyl transferase domain-containing protein [Eubacteriales bacterium]
MSSSSAARQRIFSLLDENSFVEIGAGVRARATDFNLNPAGTPSDGVITGYGVIGDRLVYVYSQDASVLGGSVGEMHARKIAGIYDLAIRTGAPVIGLLDSAGLRVQEGMDALDAFSQMYRQQAKASGVIPQITAVFGRCGGSLAVSASLSDFTLMAEGAQLFVNAPNTLAGVHEETNNTAGAASRAEAGCVDFVGNEDEVIGKVRELVGILPSNFEDDPCEECEDEMNRDCPDVASSIADPAAVAKQTADDGVFVELKEAFAKDMVTGFARFGGTPAGVIGNREQLMTADGCGKAAEFIRFCDAFGIPVITLTNATGFARDIEDENRIGLAAAKLTSAFGSATVPKINVITGSAIGGGYAVMNPKGTGADLTLALPGAKIGVMDAAIAARVLAPNADKAEFEQTKKSYEQLQNSLEGAAARGLVDQIAEPSDLRRYIIGALEILYTKREQMPARKHSSK